MILSLLYGTVTHLLLLLLRPCPSLPNIPSIPNTIPFSAKLYHCFRSSITSFVSYPSIPTPTLTLIRKRRIDKSRSILHHHHHHHLQHNTTKKNVTCNIITKIQLYLPPSLLPPTFQTSLPARPPRARPPTDARTHAVITPMVEWHHHHD